MIMAMTISLSFSGGKPCCNKKAPKNAISCKYNHAAVEKDKDIFGELTDLDSEGSLKAHKCNTANRSNCAKSCSKKPWWKFWSKESIKNCTCKQAVVITAVSEKR